ncbi:LptF/LptG family permease [Chrysiogenes arsenatis]|uniref:LptF/LptG family permease n=1 Tax=Chrysiogenes arsenatis TaxID=309797 RepID=UPI0004083BA7|nr:LptF/LptG family permease [Chrysiogenes arsenatis]
MILQRYLLKQYLVTLALTLVALLSLFLVIDSVEHFDELWLLTSWFSVVRYYASATIFALYQLLPAAVLIATILFGTHLSITNEIKVLLASGLSLRRLVAPAAVCAFFLMLGHFALGEVNYRMAMPAMKSTLKYEAKQVQPLSEVVGGNLWVRSIDGNEFAVIHRFNLSLHMFQGVEVFTLRDGVIVQRIDAASARLFADGMELHDAHIESFTGLGRQHVPSLTLPFLGVDGAARAVGRELQEYSFSELLEDFPLVVASGQEWGRFVGEMGARLLASLAVLLLFLIAIPFGITLERSGGKAFAVARGLGIAVIYYLLSHLTAALGSAGALSPWLAPFLTLAICLGGGVWLFRKILHVW